MKALVYHGPGNKSWQDVPDPVIGKPTDAIVRIERTTICGTDLHILKGDVPAVTDGRILGHEGVGVITEIGAAVTDLAVGDRVIISCISACGKCAYCLTGMYAHCQADEGTAGIGWILGHLIDGTQAEYVRIPFAETSLHRLPDGVSPDQAVLISDILPTGHEIGVRNGAVKAGDVVAVDLDPNRVAQAARFGATDAVRAGVDSWRERVLALTDGLGVDVAIEAVGVPATWDMAMALVRPGGNVAVVGVHGRPVTFQIQDAWIANLTITTGLVNTDTARMLIRMLAQGKLPAGEFISHRFALADIMAAYDTFGRAAETKALKVLLSA